MQEDKEFSTVIRTRWARHSDVAKMSALSGGRVTSREIVDWQCDEESILIVAIVEETSDVVGWMRVSRRAGGCVAGPAILDPAGGGGYQSPEIATFLRAHLWTIARRGEVDRVAIILPCEYETECTAFDCAWTEAQSVRLRGGVYGIAFGGRVLSGGLVPERYFVADNPGVDL